MKKISLIFKYVFVFMSIFLIVFTVYANIDTPPLHYYAPESEMQMYRIESFGQKGNPTNIKTEVLALDGVTACAVNEQSKILAVTFYPQKNSSEKLQNYLTNQLGLTLSKATFPKMGNNAKECPVPLGYILAIEKLKYALCFRKGIQD